MDTPPTPATEQAPHRQAWDLIPWVVAGSASAAEASLVHQHAATCTDCCEELAFHQRVKAGMHAAGPAPHSPEPALAALWARIAQTQAVPLSSTAETPAVPTSPEPRWTRWLVAAVLVQAVGLAALAALLFERPHDAPYQTFSSAAPATATAATPATLRLVPAASLPVGSLQTLLADNGLQIVASSRDGRVLSLAPVAGLAGHAAAPAMILARLRAEPGVVLVEALPHSTAP